MTEPDWVRALVPELSARLSARDTSLRVEDGRKLPYAFEVQSYASDAPARSKSLRYETDLLVSETHADGSWTPRVVIEVKLRTINTHAAIAYSQKASTHKAVHPSLRYGILLAKRDHHPLPGRLFRHGAHFDFMLSWQTLDPSPVEWTTFLDLLRSEVDASRSLEEMLYNSRRRDRASYTLLHRPLVLK